MTHSSSLPEHPLLSFTIPTYNRATFLGRLLAVLLQDLKAEDRVEVIVSDNASTDDTSAVVAAYQQQGLPIRYLRNETNLGPDFNILQCYENAGGVYTWIFGDDDLIVPGTMKRILDALSPQQYDLVFVRAYNSQNKTAPRSIFTSASDLELEKAEDLARHVHVFFTFISGMIINKKRISSLPHKPFDSLLGSYLVQLGPIYTMLNHHRRSLLIRTPLVAATSNRSVKYALYGIFGPTLDRITREWVDKKSIQQTIINGTIQTFFPSFLLLSKMSVVSSISENPHEILSPCFCRNFRYWLFDYPICTLPIPFAKIWFLTVKVINKVDKLFGNPLVRLWVKQ
ncbi:glycosyltransferase family 2 protein (plasmid) [Telmatobacter bradus]|uniref:glycosyltransferase family 2 protein n=1 Tax=Telmatobacter bradus TaxID=474953 RepID=UPI003B43CF36